MKTIDQIIEECSHNDKYIFGRKLGTIWFATYPNGQRFGIKRYNCKKSTWNSKKQLIDAIREMASEMYTYNANFYTTDKEVFVDEIIRKMNIKSVEV